MQPLTDAQKKRVEKSLPLVIYTLQKYIPLPIIKKKGWDDLYQVGCMGLVKAAGTFDESKGIRFSTYAVRCVFFEIKTYLRLDDAEKRGGVYSTVSLDQPIRSKHNVPVPLRDTIVDKHSDVESAYCLSSLCDFLQSQAEESPKTATVMPAVLGHQTQQEISEETGLMQPFLSKQVSLVRQKVRKFQREE